MGITTQLFIDGMPVDRDSEDTYQVTANVLGQIDKLLQDLAVAVPGVLIDDVNALRSTVLGIRSDASAIVADMRRFDGDHGAAMAERRFRRGEQAVRPFEPVAVPRIPRVFCRDCQTHVEPGNKCQCMEDGR